MWVFWILALFPIGICGVMLLFDKRVSYKEWLITAGVALLTAGLFQLIASIGMTDDVETWSGYATQSRQYSAWQEYYEYAVYRIEYYYTSVSDYDSKGRYSGSHQEQHSRQVFDHWEPTTRWHQTTWGIDTTLKNFNIDGDKFSYMCQKFNDRHSVPGDRTTGEHNSRMIDGDPNDYVADNRTGWVEPVTDLRHFKNKVKAAPSLFSFAKVPTNITVFAWPANGGDVFHSDRVLGTAQKYITTLHWDQMNAVLGAAKKVNLIIVGFSDTQPLSMAEWQEAKWIGGKKNDLVICFGGGSKTVPPAWVKVFGWTEKNIVKENLQTLLLQSPISDSLIPKIAEEVKADYTIKDWKKFDYITIEPPTWSYWIYLLLIVLTQGGLFYWYNVNEIDQSNDGSSRWTYSTDALTAYLNKISNGRFGRFNAKLFPPKPKMEQAKSAYSVYRSTDEMDKEVERLRRKYNRR